jgi:signal transduction histidine kinase
LLGCAGKFSPSEEELDLLQVFANQIALALENAGLYRQVHVELRKTIEDLELANRSLVAQREQVVQVSKARLATGLLHQINNAVANIPELVDEIEEKWSEADHRPLKELRRNAVAVSDISHWLHQFVRIGNLKLKQVDVVTVIQAAQQKAEDHRPKEAAGPDISAPATLPHVHADRALLEILFENLLRNAYEALPAGRPGRVLVELKVEPPECLVRVSDNGVGIAPEDRARIWEWGFSTKPLNPNTHDRGLGLYACKQIVDAHAGSIVLEDSRENEGSTFVVKLPIAGPLRPKQEL